MKYPGAFRQLLLTLLVLVASGHSLFAAAIWNKTNAVGFWRHGTNWSSSPNAPTLASGGTYVTNLVTKTVIVDSATPTTNLVINSLNVWAPPGATNTLLLQDLGPTPLVVSNNSLDLRMRGAIEVTNSSLVVTGNFIQFNLWAGTLTLDSGSVIALEPGFPTNSIIPTRIGRTNVAEFRINGGLAQVGTLQVGEAGFPTSRSHGTIHMSGGELLVLGELSIGNSLNCTGVVHLTGGMIHVPIGNTNVARVGDDGVGIMTISNASVMLNNFSVGRHTNSSGTLVLHDGGLLSALDDVSVGRFEGATGMVFMAGGELRCTNRALWIGREARGGLILSNGLVRAGALRVASLPTNGVSGHALLAGGILSLTSNIMIGALGFGTGDVVLAGATVMVTNADASAFLEIANGTVTMNGGNLAVDNLLLTNTTGRFGLNSGTLRSAASTVANGAPFVVGDGIKPAVLVLGPGLHVFSDGLIISPNATLTGCSNIIGSVINNGGTIATTNCAVSSVPPQFTQQPANLTVTQGATATFSASASGTPAPGYQWRFTVPGGTEIDVAGATSALLVISNVQTASAGDYRVIASNPSGSVTSAVATLRVLVRPTLGNVTFATTNATVSFESVSGLRYVLEYKNQIQDPIWLPLGSTNGTGGIMTLHDPDPDPAARFYRVRAD
jgi:hypothetical protein